MPVGAKMHLQFTIPIQKRMEDEPPNCTAPFRSSWKLEITLSSFHGHPITSKSLPTYEIKNLGQVYKGNKYTGVTHVSSTLIVIVSP